VRTSFGDSGTTPVFYRPHSHLIPRLKSSNLPLGLVWTLESARWDVVVPWVGVRVAREPPLGKRCGDKIQSVVSTKLTRTAGVCLLKPPFTSPSDLQADLEEASDWHEEAVLDRWRRPVPFLHTVSTPHPYRIQPGSAEITGYSEIVRHLCEPLEFQ